MHANLLWLSGCSAVPLPIPPGRAWPSSMFPNRPAAGRPVSGRLRDGSRDIDLALFASNFNQVFGRFNDTPRAPDGDRLKARNLYGFVEAGSTETIPR